MQHKRDAYPIYLSPLERDWIRSRQGSLSFSATVRQLLFTAGMPPEGQVAQTQVVAPLTPPTPSQTPTAIPRLFDDGELSDS